MWADKLYDSLKRKPIMTNLLNQPMSGVRGLLLFKASSSHADYSH